MNYVVKMLSLIGTNSIISNYLNANGINSSYTILVTVITQTSSDAFSSNYFTSDNINFMYIICVECQIANRLTIMKHF